MSTRLDIPICSVNTTQIRHLSTSVENLHGIWSVFSKCANSLEDGKRLENLSWRIWNRETFCCDSLPQADSTMSPSINLRPKKVDVPDLSASVDSLASADLDEGHTQGQLPSPSKTAPRDIQQAPVRDADPQLATSRGKERHITSWRLERMIGSIQEKQRIAPLSPAITDALPEMITITDITPRPKSPSARLLLRSSESSSSTVPVSSLESDRSTVETVGSDTSAELIQPHNVIRGFSPNQTSSSYRSHTHLAPAPIPAKSIVHTKQEQPKKAMFMLGGSSGEDESSFEEHMPSPSKQSSLTTGLKRPAVAAKKQLSFKDEVASRKLNNQSHEDEEVFASDDEDSSVDDDESEIDDDEDWEEDESVDAGDETSNERPLFQRVDSSANLVSRRSLITSALHEGDRSAAFATMAQSQPTLRKSRTQGQIDTSVRMQKAPANDNPTVNGAPMKRSKPMPMTTSNTHTMPIAFSPRTTRRNMLATEMTESLRKAVLFERRQKKATANAILKRRHTAQDLTSMRRYPGEDTIRENHSWNDDCTGSTDYNATGW